MFRFYKNLGMGLVRVRSYAPRFDDSHGFDNGPTQPSFLNTSLRYVWIGEYDGIFICQHIVYIYIVFNL